MYCLHLFVVGQCGHVNVPERMVRNSDGAYYLDRPVILPNKEGATSFVVAGWGHSAVVSTDGTAFMCGRNVQGQLG